MTIEKTIQKAIEGGWLDGQALLEDLKNRGEIAVLARINLEEGYFTLDPLFWSSLGKSMGWEKMMHINYQGLPAKRIGDTYRQPHTCRKFCMKTWLYRWHRFIDHLADGGSIEDYFKQF